MKLFSLLSLFIIVVSCNAKKDLNGSVYELSDDEQFIQIDFVSKEECKIEQSFKCEKIPDSLKYLVIEARYYLAKKKLEYSKNGKNKFLKVDFIIFNNKNADPKVTPNYTYIPNYNKLCLSEVLINSETDKVRQKISQGVFLNLVNDSIVIKNGTIFFGYKKVPRKN